MHVLVTGGGGYIGAWIIRRLLARGDDVRVFDANDDRRLACEIIGDAAKDLEWRVGDIRDIDAVAQAVQGCAAVVHLAAVKTSVCRANPARAAEINFVGTLNVFQAAKQQGLPCVIYMSSANVYGPNSDGRPDPTSHYGVLKLACEGAARVFWEDDGIASVGFRPFAVYGLGREEGNTAGPTLACRAAVRGQSYTIPFTGSADFLYVDDLAAAVEAATVQPPAGAQIFDILGEITTVDQVIAAIRSVIPEADLKAAGASYKCIVTSAHAEAAYRKLTRAFPGLPRPPLATGIRRTIEDYRSRL